MPLILEDAKKQAKNWLESLRTGQRPIFWPRCIQCNLDTEVPSDISSIAETGLCGFHRALLSLPPLQREAVEKAVERARNGDWGALLSLPPRQS